MKDWTVHKFGGTSVANADRYKGAARLLRDLNAPTPLLRNGIVVSAMSKVTDALIELTELARKRDSSLAEKIAALKEKHLAALKELAPSNQSSGLRDQIVKDFETITEILKGIGHIQSCSEATVEFVSGHGEIWSAQLLNAHFNSLGIDSAWLDARSVLVVERGETAVVVDWEKSQAKLDRWLQDHSQKWIVITGFIASTADDVPTTLKRNGSDYSAAIFGKLLKAREITIWTDVDGVLSADPRLVPEAQVLTDLSYQETSELAYFGAKVVHPSTMAPAIRDQIPIWIRNTFNPAHPGTKIHSTSTSLNPVKGFATVDKVALLNVEGNGMMGVPGVAQRLFGALRDVGISVIMISQASSEHSICFAVPLPQLEPARRAVERAFVAEMQVGLIQSVDAMDDCCILAAVGDNMANHPGIAGRFLSALGQANVNVRAIAQGSSERNISVVVSSRDSIRALRAVHSRFFLSNHTLSIGLIGVGGIGSTLLKQLKAASAHLKAEYKVDLRVRGISNSKKMLLDERAIDLETWDDSLRSKGQDFSLDRFVQQVQADHLPHSVIIDCTSSPEIAAHYPIWLERGIHVITPNKKGNTGPIDFYRKLKSISRTKSQHYLYETTVGAGLPIIGTLRELVRTGDRVVSIEGVLSGTLSYIFNSFSSSRPFSEIVAEAKTLGFTEPDPRDDLSGEDFARKLVILGREIGLPLELSDVKIEPLPVLEKSMLSVSVDEFMRRLPDKNSKMKDRADQAKAKGEVLRYVGRIDADGTASISLKTYPHDHAFAQTKSTDNIVAFYTTRYAKQPLIVQGPGAGPEVTAAGIFGDILKLCSYLGASL